MTDDPALIAAVRAEAHRRSGLILNDVEAAAALRYVQGPGPHFYRRVLGPEHEAAKTALDWWAVEHEFDRPGAPGARPDGDNRMAGPFGEGRSGGFRRVRLESDCAAPYGSHVRPDRPADRKGPDMTGITHTVNVNVIVGTIRVNLPDDDDTAAWDDLSEPDGGVFNGTTVEPWGVNEESMDRADAALAEFGFERVGPWSDDDERPTATIRRKASS